MPLLCILSNKTCVVDISPFSATGAKTVRSFRPCRLGAILTGEYYHTFWNKAYSYNLLNETLRVIEDFRFGKYA